ncbi:hypothetical protein PR202_gb21845 [Eleusine coracana subsp. coracana]|uniref:DUF6598 domain-containing protein n=1 Tax=Eleusine coracana subsp. coracana TaxID=191504 RepID=A0AAV5FE89_ELECO|nr:hypothetical protein PR202_gb21845 [Eleusine coracana subsp. coracana]
MSGCKRGVEAVVGSRRDEDSSNDTKGPAWNLPASLEKDREEQEESELVIITGRQGSYQAGLTDPYLVLAGPTRAVMVALSDPVVIEVELSVKGTTESEDKYLSFLVAPVFCSNKPGLAGNVNDEEIVLFDSGGKKLPDTSDGEINLTRRVVSVEIEGKLQVYVDVLARGKNVMRKMREFKSSEDGESNDIFNMGFCKMQVTVNWSLISYYSAPQESGQCNQF